MADEESAYPYGTGLGKVDFGLLLQSADVDAVHGLSNGAVLYSLEISIVLDGTSYRPSDVIRFDGSADDSAWQLPTWTPGQSYFVTTTFFLTVLNRNLP